MMAAALLTRFIFAMLSHESERRSVQGGLVSDSTVK
ncbi:unnamed protein product, partial [Amoebophrya sp. A120]|eukprot:GSA120T00015896001.1